MNDTSAISTMVSSLRSASELTMAMMRLRDAGEVQSKLIELNAVINAAQASAFAAQESQAALTRQIGELKAEVVRLEAWEAEKERYELVKLADGVFAYAMKESVADSTPSHHLCANCFDQRQKSILQVEERAPGRAEVHVCHRCGSELYVQGIWQPEHAKASRRSGGSIRGSR